MEVARNRVNVSFSSQWSIFRFFLFVILSISKRSFFQKKVSTPIYNYFCFVKYGSELVCSSFFFDLQQLGIFFFTKSAPIPVFDKHTEINKWNYSKRWVTAVGQNPWWCVFCFSDQVTLGCRNDRCCCCRRCLTTILTCRFTSSVLFHGFQVSCPPSPGSCKCRLTIDDH